MGVLDGKVAIITGGGSGIGRGIAHAFAREGASLVLASPDRGSLDRTAEELSAHRVPVLVAPTDVTDEGQVIALFASTMQEYGVLDILVNNAGVFDGGLLEELSLETWRKVLGVNLTGAFLCSREAMKIMKAQGAGRIMNIGSLSARMPRVGSAPYATTKHGLIGLTHATALEGRDFGVAASCLHPGNCGDKGAEEEPRMTPDELATVAVAMAAMPPHVNMYEATVLPVGQEYLGRG